MLLSPPHIVEMGFKWSCLSVAIAARGTRADDILELPVYRDHFFFLLLLLSWRCDSRMYVLQRCLSVCSLHDAPASMIAVVSNIIQSAFPVSSFDSLPFHSTI